MGFHFRSLVTALLVLLWAGSTAAVLIHGKKRLNPSEAADDLPGFGYVGQINSQSGVYLGDGWVLTAHHTTGNGSPDFVLEGTTYSAVVGSGVWLETRKGFQADLQLLRLAEPPQLARLPLTHRAPEPGTTVVMAGNSARDAGRLISWDADWREVQISKSTRLGYSASGPSGVWWGRNTVSQPSHFAPVGRTVTRAFGMRFDRDGAVIGEAVVLNGDSGGAVFAREAGQWKLAGILFARQTEAGQVGHVAVFGNTSLAVDLSYYRERILAVTKN